VHDGPGYTGHVMDASTGLTYMQQRYYDPDGMHFLSMDPVDASSSNGSNLDRYWYANDNPYRYTDPDGRVGKDCGTSGCSRDLTDDKRKQTQRQEAATGTHIRGISGGNVRVIQIAGSSATQENGLAAASRAAGNSAENSSGSASGQSSEGSSQSEKVTKEWTVQDFNDLDKRATNSYAPLFLAPVALGTGAAGGEAALPVVAPYARTVAFSACVASTLCNPEAAPHMLEYAETQQRIANTWNTAQAFISRWWQQVVKP